MEEVYLRQIQQPLHGLFVGQSAVDQHRQYLIANKGQPYLFLGGQGSLVSDYRSHSGRQPRQIHRLSSCSRNNRRQAADPDILPPAQIPAEQPAANKQRSK